MIGKTIDEIKLNETAEFSKTISESDVYLYAGLTGDLNPAHINEEYARETFFKTRIAHGMLAAGLISTVLGTRLPGPGSVYVRQELNFLAPVRIGDTVTARVEVIEIMSEKKQLRLRTTCSTHDGTTLVLDGEAIVSAPRPKKVATAK